MCPSGITKLFIHVSVADSFRSRPVVGSYLAKPDAGEVLLKFRVDNTTISLPIVPTAPRTPFSIQVLSCISCTCSLNFPNYAVRIRTVPHKQDGSESRCDVDFSLLKAHVCGVKTNGGKGKDRGGGGGAGEI